MKNHIAFKFLAIILCAAFLLGAVASGIGIVFLMASDLYNMTPDQLYEQSQDGWGDNYSQQIANAYASVKLGGCPQQLVIDFYSLWDLENQVWNGNLEYELLDSEGNLLDSHYGPRGSDGAWREYRVRQNYLELLEEPQEEIPPETVEQTTPPETTVPPSEEVTQPTEAETVPPAEDSETAPAAEGTETEAAEEAAETASTEEQPEDPTQAADSTETPTEQTELPTEEITQPPEETGPATEPVIQTEPTEPVIQEEGFSYSSWDRYSGESRDYQVAIRVGGIGDPEYLVRIRINNVAGLSPEVWELIRIVWNLRHDLFWILGSCLLLFAAMLAYLCCAAGRKPKTEEIRAAGLNRLPLDAYLVGLIFCYAAAVFGAVEVLSQIVRHTLEGAVALTVTAGYLLCLLTVHFLFAFAAQVKTPNGFWYKNSACGLCIRAIAWCYNIAIDILAWAFGIVKRICLWAWPLVKRLFRALWKLVTFFWITGLAILSRLWQLTRKGCRWCWEKTCRFMAMLPLTWQWLVAAFVMIFILALTVNSRSAGVVVIGIAACIALVLYGSSAFGILLEAARRMRQGDLDTKVQDNLLIGSFREFAGELNGLADVAVVAAQKQLKSERMKTELITNVSHDIKTPLTSIINYVDLMKRPHSDGEHAQYLEVLDRQSQRLKKLIDDLMEMSKASTGNLTVEIEVVDAAEAVNQALGEFADKLEKVPLHPVFRQPQEGITMLADGKLTWRVMSNVLSNACKYALPGTRLYVDLQKLEGKVIISLKNISREELNVEADELMERFVRGDASRNAEGSGLGLNIAKSLMELQKGELQLLVDGDLFKVTLVFPGA